MLRRAGLVVLLALAGCGGDPAPAPPLAPVPVPADRVAVAPATGRAAEVPGAVSYDPATAVLRGPHVAVPVTAVARAAGALPEPVAAAFGLAGPAVPAAGEELLLVDLAGTGTVPAGADMSVVAGAVGRPVPDGTPLAGTLLVSVPVGAPATLRVTDAGRTQTLDLATGRRTAEEAGYYPLRTGTAAGAGPPADLVLYGPGVAGQSRGDRTATVELREATATLQPYVEGRGWAAEGRAFLVLDATLGYERAGAPAPDMVTVPAASFSAGPLRLGGPAVTLRGPTGTARFVVAGVPAATGRVALRFAFRGTVRAAVGEVTYQPTGGGPQTATMLLG